MHIRNVPELFNCVKTKQDRDAANDRLSSTNR